MRGKCTGDETDYPKKSNKIFLERNLCKKLDGIKNSIMFASMKVEKKKQRESGSVKIDPKVYREAADYCDNKGLKITFFATEAVSEKLEKEKLKLQSSK